jgi:hypothetical protein
MSRLIERFLGRIKPVAQEMPKGFTPLAIRVGIDDWQKLNSSLDEAKLITQAHRLN